VRSAFAVVAITLLLMMGAEAFWGGSPNKVKLLILELLIIMPAFAFVLIRRYPLKKVFRWQRTSGRILLLSVFIGLGLTLVMDGFDRLFQRYFPMMEELLVSLEAVFILHRPGDIWLLLLGAVIIPGFSEELLFRGFFQKSMEASSEVTKAVLATAFVFAFVHFNPWWFIQILIAGILLGVLAWRTRSLFPCIVVHTVKNGLAVWFTNLGDDRITGLGSGLVGSLASILIGAMLTAIGFVLVYRYTEGQPSGSSYTE
jgi:membrane protease YdiL (CAAX protease family)